MDLLCVQPDVSLHRSLISCGMSDSTARVHLFDLARVSYNTSYKLQQIHSFRIIYSHHVWDLLFIKQSSETAYRFICGLQELAAAQAVRTISLLTPQSHRMVLLGLAQ